MLLASLMLKNLAPYLYTYICVYIRRLLTVSNSFFILCLPDGWSAHCPMSHPCREAPCEECRLRLFLSYEVMLLSPHCPLLLLSWALKTSVFRVSDNLRPLPTTFHLLRSLRILIYRPGSGHPLNGIYRGRSPQADRFIWPAGPVDPEGARCE